MYETHVSIQGRLVADPVVKEGRHGPFTTFRVAQSTRRQVRGEPGQWTDGTSMALCLAESLIESAEFDAVDQLARYVRWKRHGHLSSNGRCFDIGSTVVQALTAGDYYAVVVDYRGKPMRYVACIDAGPPVPACVGIPTAPAAVAPRAPRMPAARAGPSSPFHAPTQRRP